MRVVRLARRCSTSILYCGSAVECLKKIKTGSVNAVLADVPFSNTNARWDEWALTDDWWDQIHRVTTDTCPVVLLVGGKAVFRAHASNPSQFRFKMVWVANRGSNFLQVRYRPMNIHNDLLVFSKRFQCLYYPVKRAFPVTKKYSLGSATWSSLHAFGGKINTIRSGNVRHPVDVIFCDKTFGRGRRHQTEKPVELFDYLVRTFSKEGDVVLDCFMGSGTTGEACIGRKRNFVGVERDKEIFDCAVTRLKNYASLWS